MLDSNTILGIRAYLECEEYEHGLLVQNIDAWPCGTPVVYAANALNQKALRGRGISTRVYTLMPPCQSAAGVETAQVHVQSISPVGLRPLYNNHKVLTVSRFDVGKFDRLLEFTRDVGAISLVIEYEGGRKQLAESVVQLERKFKYCSLFSYNGWGDRHLQNEDDKFVCILTFLDLPYCIPLFNTRKVDGVGLSFTGATVKASLDMGHLYRTFRADFIYTNYEDNVFFVDGIAINSMRPPSPNIYEELNNFARKHFEVGKPDKKKKSKAGYGYNYDGSIDKASKWATYPSDAKIDPSSEEVLGMVVHGTLDTVMPGHDLYHNGKIKFKTTDNGPISVDSEAQLDETMLGNKLYKTSDEFVWNLEASVDPPADNEETEPEEGGN